jgi:putative membrane protein
MMHEWWDTWGSGSGMLFGHFLTLILFFAAIIFAMALLRSFVFQSSERAPRSPTAKEILDQRFAKGEIDKDEYEAKRRLLGG